MIDNEKYINFLKQIIACISHGDYYSVKELSQLELDKMERKIKEENKKNKRCIWFNKQKMPNSYKWHFIVYI